MQLARARLVVVRKREADIDAGLHKLAEYCVVSFVSARPIPAEENDTLEIAFAQQMHKSVELRPLHPITYGIVVAERESEVFLETRMSFRNDPVGREALERDRRDRKVLAVCKAGILGLLIFDRILLVGCVVRALAVVYEKVVAVLAALDLFQYLLFMFCTPRHARLSVL